MGTNEENGVDVERLNATINAIRSNPAKGRLTLRGTTRWEGGAYSTTQVRNFTLHGDEPESFVGTNRAQNSVETLLAALGSCLATGFAYNAAAQGIRLDSLEIDIEGDLDLRGLLGISEEVRAGPQEIRVRIRAEGDAPREKIQELCRYVQRTSPVTDVLRNAVSVSVDLQEYGEAKGSAGAAGERRAAASR
jgi:uncharacterized OsmC-like protein